MKTDSDYARQGKEKQVLISSRAALEQMKKWIMISDEKLDSLTPVYFRHLDQQSVQRPAKPDDTPFKTVERRRTMR